jgi:nucleotide-binding universal stress UspA family protein
VAVHVLIATDGSDPATRAATRACQLVRAPDRITLLTVLTEMPGDDAGGLEGSVYTPEEQERLWQEALAEAGEELTRAAVAVAAPGAQILRRIEYGDAAGAITKVAADDAVDLIVVGSHGHTGLARVFLGSVSEHVVRHAPCPVLVVR